jgi:hypothetical protein
MSGALHTSPTATVREPVHGTGTGTSRRRTSTLQMPVLVANGTTTAAPTQPLHWAGSTGCSAWVAAGR